jgi:hypothetical protein
MLVVLTVVIGLALVAWLLSRSARGGGSPSADAWRRSDSDPNWDDGYRESFHQKALAFLIGEKMSFGKKVVLDQAAKETEFEIDGSTYTLRFNFAAISNFEAGTGINLGIQSMPPTAFNFLCLLYAGLGAHHPELPMRTVEAWFDENRAGPLCKLAWEAYYGPLKEQSEAPSENPQNPLKA